MKYEKFHELIEAQNPEQKQALYKRIKQNLNLPDNPAENTAPAAKKFKKPARLAACISAAVAVVCLAIILPFALGGNGGNTPQIPSERYCYANDCIRKELDCNMKEYAEQNNLPLLYLDWYDFVDVDEFQTFLFVNKDDETDIVFMQELFNDGENGRTVEVYITDIYTKIDDFEDAKDALYDVEYISSVKVLWGEGHSWGRAYLEYNGYRYLIKAKYYDVEGDILDIVRAMLP